MRCYTNDAGGDAMRVVALGTFDGVHLGHQAVLEVAQTIAMCEKMTSCAVTFLNHPLSVVGAGAPPLLTLPGEKALLAAHCGLNELRMLRFTKEFAAQEPEEYVRMLVDRLHARHIVVGENHTFGARGSGDIALLDALSPFLITDMSRGRLINAAWAAKDYVQPAPLSIAGVHQIGSDGFMQFYADEDSLRRAVLELFYEAIE